MSGIVEDRLKQLKDLPELVPPAALEGRALAAMARATRRRAHGWLPLAAAWLAIAGATSWLGFHLLDVELPEVERNVVSFTPQASQGEDGSAHGVDGSAQDDRAAPDARADDERVAAWLAAESKRLEQILHALPPPRRVMRIGTAGTIVGLEDRLAVIDAALVDAGAETPPPQYRNALLLDRVEVMNALVNVRYAQSQAFAF